jgi:pyruvate/2-oxoglutarate dehydrogenase complex dihydrolipoamide dehydrogenase (E3) component
MPKTKNYDAIVIGSGQGGNPLSKAMAEAGWKTLLIEKEQVGGTCINKGCTPTKTMIASARVAYMAQRAKDYGIQTGPISIDMKSVRQRKRDIVESFRNGSERKIERTDGLDLLFGVGSFTGSHSVEVRDNQGGLREFKAPKIFINIGARPARPDITGLDDVPVLDYASITELDHVPEHLLVLGGGYIGLEFAQMFRRFGSRVTIVQRGVQLLTHEDPDVAREVKKVLQEDGIKILLETKAQHVEGSEGKIQMSVHTPDEDKILKGSHLFLAVGRVPNTDILNLERAHIHIDKKGFIQVNEKLETNTPGVYALGDVKGGHAFTHISYDDYRILRDNLLEGGNSTTHDRVVPYTVYIDPQLGRVGLSESEAKLKGYQIRVAKMPMNYVARALEVDETRGFLKVVVDGETDQILGAAVLGIEGGEIIATIQMAMMGKIPYTVLQNTIFAHPTLAESLNNLFSFMT